MPPHTLTFVVEDGTGIPEANSFITYDFARQFWFDHGYGDFAETDAPALPAGFLTAAAAVAGVANLSLDQGTTAFAVAENQYVGAMFTLPHNATSYTIESHDTKTTIDTAAVAFVVTAGLVIDATDNSPLAPGAADNHVYLQQAAIVRGSRWISDSFDWEGRRKTLRPQTPTRGQGLAWPRIWAIDDEGDRGYGGYGGRALGGYGIFGDWVDSDSVPEEIQKATAEAAWYEVQNPHELSPTFIAADRVKREKAGAVSVDYVADDLNAFNTRPVLHKVLDLCEHLISETSKSSMFGSSARG